MIYADFCSSGKKRNQFFFSNERLFCGKYWKGPDVLYRPFFFLSRSHAHTSKVLCGLIQEVCRGLSADKKIINGLKIFFALFRIFIEACYLKDM